VAVELRHFIECHHLKVSDSLDREGNYKGMNPSNLKFFLYSDPAVIEKGMTFERAMQLRAKLLSKKVRATVLPEKYLCPEIALTDAWRIAEAHLLARAAREYPNLHFEKIGEFRRHDIRVFRFALPCREWQEQERVPGALICTVDKVDGHVWGDAEFEDFLRETQQIE
jgi:hypothetical protein